jgi:large repetitive protein
VKKKLPYLILLLVSFPLLSQNIEINQHNNQNSKSSFDKKLRVEDSNGHLITDSLQRELYFIKRQKEIQLNSTFTKKSSLSLAAVQMCTNGSFEEFETVSGTNILKHFEYTTGNPQNPTQCKSVDVIANQGINQYNPANNGLMATTVPSNFIDEYIGNISAFDQYTLKINYKESFNTSSIVQAKRFKTNNETSLKFNYKSVLQSITENGHINEQPFFKVRILNNTGTIVSEFCLVGDPQNCSFSQAPNLEGGSVVLYNKNWQSGILDISTIPNNEEFTIEFTASRCGLGGHFGYAYIDDICLLHSTENLQGSIELDPLFQICPSLPISVCGSYTLPNSGGISATVTSITMNVYNASNTVVYTSSSPTTINTTTNRFCFDLTGANLPNITTGNYNVGGTINYGITQTNCTGASFSSVSDDDANPGWDISFLNCTNDCNITLQTGNIELCDSNRDGKEFFDLSNINIIIAGTQNGLLFNYYTTLTDATNNTNAIQNFSNYESYSRTIFVRVNKSATCYKIIAIQLIVKNPTASISGILNVCNGSTTLTASLGASYLWSTGATTPSINVNSIGTYTIEVTDTSGCKGNGSVNILANQVAVQPTIIVTQPSCFVSTGTISIISPASEYSFDDGITWTTNSSMSNLAVGNYLIKIKTASGCLSYNTSINIEPFLLSFPYYSSINPTSCGGFGSITITTVASEYSFDDGITWSTNNTMTNLPSGTYNIRTKNQFGCISNFNSVVLNGEFLSSPNYTKVQPSCGLGGSITITTLASEYSFDGGTTWQTSNTLTNQTNGSYIIKIKNTQGCTSVNTYVYLSDFSASYPNFATTQPSCGTNGSITITTLADFYSFDGGTTWSTNPTASNLTTGVYYILMIKNSQGCTSQGSYTYLNPFYLPYPNFTTTNPNCGTGGSITITTNATEYSFDGGNTWVTNPVALNLAGGSYNVMIKNDLGCVSYSNYAYLSESYLPYPEYTVVQPTCATGGTLTITTIAAQYSFGNGNTWTTNPVLLNLTSGSYYYIKIKNSAGCESYTQYVYTYQSNPVAPSYASVQPTCSSSGSITITTTATEYSFDNGLTWTTNPTVSNLTPGYFTLKIKDTQGCLSDSQYVYLYQANLPDPIYTVVQPTCETTGTISITTVAADYSFDNGSTWSTNPILSNLAPGYYQVKVRTQFACVSQSIAVYLNFSYLPVPTFTKTDPFCTETNGTITITPISGYLYSFDNGYTYQNSNISNPLLPGSYNIKVKNTIGCESPSVYIIINNPSGIPPAPTGTLSQQFCLFNSPTLSSLKVVGQNLKWYSSPTSLIVLASSTALVDGTTYYASQTINGCESPNRLGVTALVSNIPIPAINYETTLCDDLNNNLETVNLSNYNNNLINNSANYSFAYYTSLIGAQNEIPVNLINNFNAYTLNVGDNKIYVRVTSYTTCYEIVTLQLTVIASPIITMPNNFILCENKTVRINAENGFYSYLWSTGSKAQSITVDSPGNYWLVVEEKHGTLICSTKKDFVVSLSNIASITAIESEDWTNNENIISIYVSGLGRYEYSINGLDFQDSNQFSGLEMGLQTVYVRDKNGCGSSTGEIYLLMYPKFFTPNGDGFNDTWKIKFSSLEPNLKYQIYDRYGKLLKEVLNDGLGWDGTYNGIELPANDYWFLITRPNGKQHKGHFALKR